MPYIFKKIYVYICSVQIYFLSYINHLNDWLICLMCISNRKDIYDPKEQTI